tara:strand:+ start:788 stop:1093 length:306 start_codon:yes stop_codon:yes gene_type:complete
MRDDLENKIIQWHKDRNLINGSTDLDQYQGKLLEEVDELGVNIVMGNKNGIVDDIGDIIVVLINIAHRNNLTLYECMHHAYNDIKDRKGKMIDGVFVKEAK